MKKFDILCARVSSLAIIALLLVIITSGCGGGGDSNPLQPVVPPPASPEKPSNEWRLCLTNTTIKSGGKSIYEYMLYADKIIDMYDAPVELRFRFEFKDESGQWTLHTGQDFVRLDIRVVGIGSGEFAPQLTILPPHEQSFSSTTVWWVEPAKGSGQIDLVAEVYSSEGILCSLAFGLYLHGNTEEPPSCRELHPAREAINGFWWDCINGGWVNTGEPVDDPNPNNSPVITGYYPSQGFIQLTVGGESQVFSLSGYDPDNDPLTKWWKLGSGSDNPIQSDEYIFNPTDAGTWVLKGILSDGDLQAEHCWTIEVKDVDPPPPDNNLYPTPSGEITAYYSGAGLQSIPLEVDSLGGLGNIGFILWEIVVGPSGAMTVPLGEQPTTKCEFYYGGGGVYTVWSSPYSSEGDYQDGDEKIGKRAVFTVTVIDG